MSKEIKKQCVVCGKEAVNVHDGGDAATAVKLDEGGGSWSGPYELCCFGCINDAHGKGYAFPFLL